MSRPDLNKDEQINSFVQKTSWERITFKNINTTFTNHVSSLRLLNHKRTCFYILY